MQKYVDTLAADPVYDLKGGFDLSPPLGHSWQSPFEDGSFGAVPSTPISHAFAPALQSHDPTVNSMQVLEEVQNIKVPLQVPFPSQLLRHPSSELPWPMSQQQEAQGIGKVPGRIKARIREPRLIPQHLQPQTPSLPHSLLGEGNQTTSETFGSSTADRSATIGAKKPYTSSLGQTSRECLRRYANGYASLDYGEGVLHRQHEDFP